MSPSIVKAYWLAIPGKAKSELKFLPLLLLGLVLPDLFVCLGFQLGCLFVLFVAELLVLSS